MINTFLIFNYLRFFFPFVLYNHTYICTNEADARKVITYSIGDECGVAATDLLIRRLVCLLLLYNNNFNRVQHDLVLKRLTWANEIINHFYFFITIITYTHTHTHTWTSRPSIAMDIKLVFWIFNYLFIIINIAEEKIQFIHFIYNIYSSHM